MYFPVLPVAGSCGLRARSNGGEGGGELCERPRECHSCVAYRKGDELHTSPVSLEGRDEGGVLMTGSLWTSDLKKCPNEEHGGKLPRKRGATVPSPR